jgi:hypothetical protein
MKKLFLFISAAIICSSLHAQQLSPDITWGTIEKITIPGGDLIVSSGNDGRNEIQYWERSATLVIGSQLFFKASPPLPDTIDWTTSSRKMDTVDVYPPVGQHKIVVIKFPVDTAKIYMGETCITIGTTVGKYTVDSTKVILKKDGTGDSLCIGWDYKWVGTDSTKLGADTVWNRVYEHQLWVTNGSDVTKQVPGTNGLKEPMHLIEANGILYFTAIDGTGTRFMFKYDGNTTTQVSQYPNPYALSQFGTEILFGVQGPTGYYTCITDAGQPAGSRIISQSIGPAPNRNIGNCQQWSQYAPFQVIRDRQDENKLKAIYFGLDDKYGIEICVTDGQTANVIVDIEDTPNQASSIEGATMSTDRGDICIAVNKHQVAFRVVTPAKWGRDTVHIGGFQQNMWITDGTPKGTWLFEDQNRTAATVAGKPATGNSFAGDPFLFQGSLYYTGTTTHDRQIVVMKNTYPNHLTNGTSREEWIVNGPDNAGTYANMASGYFGTYGDKMAFSVRVSKVSDAGTNNKFNSLLEHALIVGNTYENLYVADSSKHYFRVSGNGNNDMLQHITQYKDKLYYNSRDEVGARNLRVYVKAEYAAGWNEDKSFWLGNFSSNEGNNSAKGGPHNFRVMNGSLYFIFKDQLYKFTDTQSTATTPVFDYRKPEHYVAEGVKDWQSCIFDYGYGGPDWECPIGGLPSNIQEVVFSREASVYPNPAIDRLNIDFGSNQAKRVIVFNIAGERVLDQPYTSDVINVSSLPSGHYVIGVITTDNIFVHTRFIKQ